MIFDGKVAMVSGSGSGIGRATAMLLAERGARVVVSDVVVEGGEETVENIRKAGGEAAFVGVDVSEAEQCAELVRRTKEAFGRLDIACNNAGIGGEANRTADYSIEGWEKVIAVNLSGVFYCMKYEIPAMREVGGGAIVNVSSILGRVAFSKSPAYVASKHGLLGLTETAAIEYAKEGIRINSIGPAFIETPMIAGLQKNPEIEDWLISLHPMGRLGKPEEVAELIVWLSSDQASFITGSYYAIDGGYLAR